MAKPTSFRPTDENDAYIREQAGEEGLTPWLNSIIEMVRTGALVSAKHEANTITKSKEELEKERLAVDIEIKKQIRDMNELDRKNAQADFDLKQERLRKLRYENDARESQDPLRQLRPVTSSSQPAAVATIQAEIAKDTATPTPAKKPNSVRELPPGLGIVGCDNCHEVFIFDNPDKALDDFLDHIGTHHRTEISHNEVTQFRYAKARIERGATT